jgi:hypothetical protein
VHVMSRSLLLWLALLVLAMANGAFREGVLLKRMPRGAAYVTSGVLLSAAVLAVAWLGIGWLGAHHLRQFVLIGVLWLTLTLVFEFTFGMLVRGKPLAEMLDAYRFRDGDIWPVVLAVIACAPAIAAWVRRLL